MPETPTPETAATTPDVPGLQTASLNPAENKSLTPAALPEPAPEPGVKVALNYHYDFAGENYLPGDEPTLPESVADVLVKASWATKV